MGDSTFTDRRRPEFIYPRIYVALPDVGEPDLTLSKDDSPVETKLAADLVVFYAYDLDSHFEIISNSELRKLGATSGELHILAVENLNKLNLDIRAHGDGPTRMLTAGGNFEATLLFLPYVWDSVSSMVDGRVIASVPTRDVVYFTGDADPKNLSDMRKWTSRMLELGDKPLSRYFLARTSSGWESYKGHAD